MTDEENPGNPRIPGNPRARHTDPDTSKAASEESERRTAIKMNLLSAYIEVSMEDQGLTDEEAMLRCNYDLSDDGHRRRCSDLRDDGWISQVLDHGVGVKRLSQRTGKMRMVCAPTLSGIEAWENYFNYAAT